MSGVDDMVDALVEVARPIIRQSFDANSCIASTRIGIDALAYFGVKAEPLPVVAMVFNAEAGERINSGEDIEQLMLDATDRDAPGGPWSIGIGTGMDTKDGQWAGHLILTVPDERIICDLSFDQISRPHKNLMTEPYWVRADDDKWWAGTSPALGLSAGEAMVFLDQARPPDPRGYLTSPNWALTGMYRSAFKRTTGEVIRAMRNAI